MPDTNSLQEALRAAEPTRISQLNPDLSHQKTRIVDGAVTITWPFSIVTKAIAFIIAERDFRLRRDKGQVRIKFHGAAAKAIADASVGGGDEIRISLDGVKWEKNESNTQLAGSTLEWQLEFTNHLRMLIRNVDSQEGRVIDIDVPGLEADVTNGQVDGSASLDRPPTSDLAIPLPDSLDDSLSTKRTASLSFESHELSSPAFIKRARVSYGSLFEGGFDIFDEDVGRKSKTKKKSRFSLPANAWRYSSRSPSPEAEPEPESEPEVTTNEPDGVDRGVVDGEEDGNIIQTPQDASMTTLPRPSMVDEGCQTDEVDFTPMNSVQVSAESRPAPFAFSYSTPTPLPRTRPIEAVNDVLDHSLQLQPAPNEEPHPQSELSTGFLRHSPAHAHHGLPFGHSTSQTMTYPSPTNPFTVSRSEEVLEGPVNDFHVPEDYPASFLDNPHLHTTTTDSHPPLPSHGSSYEPEAPEQDDASFAPESHFLGSYHPTSQPPQNTWTSEVAPATFGAAITSITANHPVEILSSSPMREHAESEEMPYSPSERTGLVSVPPHFRHDEPISTNTLDGLEEERHEGGVSEEEHYRDGGDRPGDDYDLRNYDRAHDDDDDVDESEEDVESDPEDPDEQIINPEEDAEGAEADGEEYDQMESDEEVATYDSQAEEGEDTEGQEYGEYEDDAEGEYYSEEEDYDEDDDTEEEEEEEEEEEAPLRPAAPSQPVFISLLSDSEDEDERASELVKATEVEAKGDTKMDEAPEEQVETAQLKERETAIATGPEEPEQVKEVQQTEGLAEPSRLEKFEAINVAEPKKPSQSKEAEQLEHPGEVHKPEQPKELEESKELDQAKEFEHLDQPEEPEKPEHAEGAGNLKLLGEPELSTQPEQSQKPEKPETQTFGPSPTVKKLATEPTMPSVPESLHNITKTIQIPGQEMGTENVGISPADEMDVDEKHSGPPVPPNTAEDINSAEMTRIEYEESTAIQRPLDQHIQAPEQRMEDNQQDGDPELSVVAAESPDQEANVAPPAVEKQDGKANEVDATERPEDAHPITGETINSTDAMDVDEPNDAHAERHEDLTATTDQAIADMIDVVKEVRGAIPEVAPTNIDIGQDSLNQVPTSAGSPTTPGNGVKLSPFPSAPAQEIEPIQEGADPNLEAQGQGHVDSPDATMQDASQAEVTAGSRLSQAGNMPETGNGEAAGQTNVPQQLLTGGQMSPPATQVSHTQPSQENREPTLSQDTSTFPDQEHRDHLPTPGESQVEEIAMAGTGHFTEEHDDQANEDDLSPEDQIIAEIMQHSPIKYHTKYQQHSYPAVSSPAASPKPGPELTETTRDLESNDNPPKSDVLSTVKSLRSRGHRSIKSKSSDISQPDPSILLAKPPSTPKQPDDDVKTKSTPTSLRSKTNHTDPSIQLARASAHAKVKGKERGEADRVRNSPPMKLRISRSRVDHQADPSIQLAKGLTASTRQPRRPATPEQPRPSSRGVVPRTNTPDTAVTALQSPSVAGSSGAPENETVGAVKLQLLKSLRTSLPDFVSLKMLRNSINQATDILAFATTTPVQAHRPKHGPRDYMLTLILTDPSVGPAAVAVAHIFRPHQSSLPVVHAGDVVLLRRVQVVSMKKRGFGVRANDASAWAVFEKGDDEMLPQIRGPPVEVTEDELKYVEGLRRWWNLLDDKAKEKIEKANRKILEASQEDVK